MCGICGVVYRDSARSVDSQTLKGMADTIWHRGPDAEGYYLDGPVGLASRRLSIIDLEGGDQPIYSEDRSLVIVFNGEIYNYAALRAELVAAGHQFATDSDTETIIHGYEQWGCGALDRLNGMFAFALWDARHRRLLVARDRTGIKPLYYASTGSAFLFGSEIKAILAHPGIERRIDPAALDAYLTFEFVPAPFSIFEGICKLPPGHLLILEDGETHIERYWDFPLECSEEPGALTEAEAVDGLRAALREAVELEMVADVPIGVLLSGGIDSSAVAAAMTQVSPGNVQSFSIAMDDPSFDESQYARLAARHLGTRHHERAITAADLVNLVPKMAEFMDEPLADSSIIPTTLLSRFVREHVKVALGGDGGDELFAGYSTLQAHRLMQPYERLVPRRLRALIPAVAARMPTSFDNISLDFKVKRFAGGAGRPLGVRHQQWLGSFTSEEKGHLLRPDLRCAPEQTYSIVEQHLAACQAENPLNRVLYLDMKMYMEGDILPKVDRASMSASLEVRVPLLNRVMLDFAARLPLEYKLRGLTTKYLLRRAIEDTLPPRIRRRGKKGFNVPIARWIAGPLLGMTRDLLHPDRLQREGFFEPDAVQTLINDHVARRRDARKLLWTLLTFEMWYQQWAS